MIGCLCEEVIQKNRNGRSHFNIPLNFFMIHKFPTTLRIHDIHLSTILPKIEFNTRFQTSPI